MEDKRRSHSGSFFVLGAIILPVLKVQCSNIVPYFILRSHGASLKE